MTVTLEVDVVTSSLFRPRDLRDPLGIWGARVGATGDGSGGGVHFNFNVPDDNAGAYVYTCYSVNCGQLTGILEATGVSIRLLTNWPNVDPQAGVQGYNAMFMGVERTQQENTGQLSAPTNTEAFTVPNMRYILLFDPRPSAGEITLVQVQRNDNTLDATYIAEVYGYFWDRQVMNTAGGLRHPGSD